MNFYTQQHTYYCGLDLHAKAMYVCILDKRGTKLVHKNLPTTSEAFLRVIAPGTPVCSSGDGVGAPPGWLIHRRVRGVPARRLQKRVVFQIWTCMDTVWHSDSFS